MNTKMFYMKLRPPIEKACCVCIVSKTANRVMFNGTLREQVNAFRAAWFPEDGQVQKFWFRARDPKYRQVILALCEIHMHAVSDWMNTMTPGVLFQAAKDETMSTDELIILAVMLDQMPRNALAIGFGEFCGKDPTDVKNNISDEFYLSFARLVREEVGRSPVADHRILCFFSLVFRHSNDFSTAKAILEETRLPDGSLPPLADRFLVETSKRECQTAPKA